MQDLIGMLQSLNRPRLLIRAARLGAENYRRNPHLKRVLRTDALPRSGPALMQLLEIEAATEALRAEQDAAYSIARHVDLLIAMMGEARLLKALSPRPDAL